MMTTLGVAMNGTTIEAYAAGKGLDLFGARLQAERPKWPQMFFEKTEQYAGNSPANPRKPFPDR